MSCFVMFPSRFLSVCSNGYLLEAVVFDPYTNKYSWFQLLKFQPFLQEVDVVNNLLAGIQSNIRTFHSQNAHLVPGKTLLLETFPIEDVPAQHHSKVKVQCFYSLK
jgi:hypothetical protein